MVVASASLFAVVPSASNTLSVLIPTANGGVQSEKYIKWYFNVHEYIGIYLVVS